ncbi:MAG: sigma-70 family RNA polymerase sigma factor [Nanoarchaeota archaeon]
MIAIDEKLLRELSDAQPDTRNKAYVRLRNYCLEIAGLMAWRASGIDREELAQTALTRIIRAGDCGNYDPSQSSPSTYIKTIVRRTCISMLRAKKARINPKHLEDYAIPSPDRSAGYITSEQKEQNDILHAAVNELKPPRRDIIELAYFRGESLSEVARSLSIPLGTVKSHLHKALIRLRKTLKDERLEQTLAA